MLVFCFFFSIQYDLLLFFFKFKRSFPSIFMMIDVGVTTKKNTIPIISGEIRFPIVIPILNHILFKGVKIFDFINPKIKKITEMTSDQYLISLALSKGQIAMIKKTIENIIPKLLLEPILILLFFKANFLFFGAPYRFYLYLQL